MSSGVLITGPVGVGKTTVAIAAGDILQERGAAAAIVDLDWLGWLVGCDVEIRDVIARNLTAIWPHLSNAGADHLILTRAVENDDDVALLRDAVPGVSLAVARLTASATTIERRLRGRDSGVTLQEHLIQAGEMERALANSSIAEVVISTDERTAEDVAAELLDSLGWQ